MTGLTLSLVDEPAEEFAGPTPFMTALDHTL